MPNTFSQKYNLFTGKKINSLQLILLLANSVFGEILPWVVFFASYSFILFLIGSLWKIPILTGSNKAISTLLLVFNLGLPSLLLFRTNTANDRFWEARRLWGDLVNVVRNLTREISIIVQDQDSKSKKDKKEILLLVVAFAISMKLHLRSEKVNDEIILLMSTEQFYQLKYNSDHPPLQIAFWIGDYLQFRCDRGDLHIYQLVALHNLVNILVNILGGCERILKTPQPIIYTLLLRKLVIIYCLLLPLEVVQDFQGFSVVIITFVSIILFGIEEIGSQLEHPFALNPNALPLDLICNTILQNVQELIEQINYPLKDSKARIKHPLEDSKKQINHPLKESKEQINHPLKESKESVAKRNRKKKLIALKKSLIVSLDNEHLN